jgi:hypothetical protein
MLKPAALAALLAAALAGAAPPIAPAHEVSHGNSVTAATATLGPDAQARRLGLQRGSRGGCGALFLVSVQNAPDPCSHGPDPPPPGSDGHRSFRELDDGSGRTPLADQQARIPYGGSPFCEGDGMSGKRIQAVYGRPAGSPDRFDRAAPLIVGFASQVDQVFDASAAETGGSRHPRFVFDRRCRLSILDIEVTAAAAQNFDVFIEEMLAQGLDVPDRKYMVWFDAEVICGIGAFYLDDSPGPQNQNNATGQTPLIARVDRGCWGQLPDIGRSAEAHELTHTLGAVQPSAPHSTAAGHCFDEHDSICYDDDSPISKPDNVVTRPDGQQQPLLQVCPPASEALLDCSGDDYFSTAPSGWLARHWNTAVSDFLATSDIPDRPPQTRITSGPRGTISSGRPKFRFGASEPIAGYRCRLDRRPPRRCRSGRRLPPLEPGHHRLGVSAIDLAGNVDPTPAKRRFSIED